MYSSQPSKESSLELDQIHSDRLVLLNGADKLLFSFEYTRFDCDLYLCIVPHSFIHSFIDSCIPSWAFPGYNNLFFPNPY